MSTAASHLGRCPRAASQTVAGTGCHLRRRKGEQLTRTQRQANEHIMQVLVRHQVHTEGTQLTINWAGALRTVEQQLGNAGSSRRMRHNGRTQRVQSSSARSQLDQTVGTDQPPRATLLPPECSRAAVPMHGRLPTGEHSFRTSGLLTKTRNAGQPAARYLHTAASSPHPRCNPND